MKLSLDWIKDFVDIPIGSRSEAFDTELSKLVYDLTMSTVEVEDAIDLGGQFENIVIGEIHEINPHPDADKLVVCKVSVGDHDNIGDTGDAGGNTGDGAVKTHDIVCGGINLRVGMKVAVALPGAKVRWHGEGDLVELKKTKVRGVESYGMICASSEIGLFDLFPYTEEATIVDLSDFDAPPGTRLDKALGIDDVILVIDNKSLTNRPDLWGHYGIARELAAIYDLPLKPLRKKAQLSSFKDSPDIKNDGFEITIKDAGLCPRYTGVRIENVSPKPAPFELQSRLWRVGVRPINAIVDITNYVMLETGNPTHAFDADVVQGNICVRRAAAGEKLLLLSGDELELTTDDLVIADEKEAIALAGVMGGAKDSILPETKNVILEVANFNDMSVRRTTMHHEIRTEASTRYEKGIDPQRVDDALTAAGQLFAEIFSDIRVTGYFDCYPAEFKCSEVDVSLTWLEKRLGQRMSPKHITKLLERLGFDVNITGDNMHVKVPSWRSTGDISLPDDIMEEIARIHGLENFDPAPIVISFDGAINQLHVDIDRKIREYLAYNCGMYEISTYPWTDDMYVTATLGGNSDMLEMTAPPSPGECFVRKSLIPGLCKAVAENLRYFDDFKIFEAGQVFFDKDYSAPYDKREMLPLQRRYVAGAFVAPRESYAELYRLTKGAIEAMPRLLHMQSLEFGATQQDGSTQGSDGQAIKPYWADDVIYLSITSGSVHVGDIGLLSQSAASACGIKNAAVMLFELDVDALEPLPSRENSYKRIPEYPMTDYDISLLFDSTVKWDEIRNTAAGKEGPDNLLRGVGFVEEYKGSKIPAGKKSVTLRLNIGSLTKTLTSDEIEACVNSVIKRLSKNLGAEKR